MTDPIYKENRSRWEELAYPKEWHSGGRQDELKLRKHKPGRVWNWHKATPYWAWKYLPTEKANK